jgi:VCBS repeat-containing protein
LGWWWTRVNPNATITAFNRDEDFTNPLNLSTTSLGIVDTSAVTITGVTFNSGASTGFTTGDFSIAPGSGDSFDISRQSASDNKFGTAKFDVTYQDAAGNVTTTTIELNVAAVNDTPVLAAVSGGTVTDTAGDDIYTDVTGVLTGSDRDGDTVGFELSGSTGSLAAGFDVEKSSSYGTFYLNSTSGAYKFVADDAAVEALKTSATVDFVVNATDGSLDSAAQTITITLAGTNDTPVLAAVSGGTVTDTAGDDIYTDVTGVLTGSDRDGDTVGFELSGSTGSLAAGFDVEKSSSYGTFYLNSTSGAYKFVADDAAVEALKTSATVDFVVNATDGSLDSAAQTITITLAGTNDTPVLAAVSGGTVTDTAGDDIYTDVTGVLTGSDRDGDTVGFELSGSTGSLAAGFDVEKSSSYGTFYLNSTSGAYKFVADDAAVEALKTSATVDFVVNATDGSLDSAAQTITITLAGTNDTPVLAAVSGGTVTDTAGDDIYTDVTGVLTGSDRDGDTVGFELSGSTGSLAAGFDVEKSSSYGTFYLNSTSGAYKFVADDAAVEALKTSATVDFVVNATDGSLDSAAQTITITLAGTNDTPVLAAVSGGTVTDTAGDDIYTDVTGVLTGSDRDGDTVGFELSGSTGSLAAGFDVEKSSSYGTFYLNSTSGAYKFVADDAAVEALKTSATVDFVVNATDGSLDSAAQTITITLAGTNDTPVLAAVSGGTVTDTAGDDIYTDVTGVLTGSDRDGDTVGFELSGSTGSLAAGFDVEKSSSYGTFYLNSTSGAYKFVADDAAVEALKTSATVDFVVNATDGSLDSAAQTITITLAGTNDTPVLAAVSGGTVTDTAGDDIYTDVTGVLTGSDRDGDTVGFELSGSTGSLAAGFDVEKSSSYGTFYLNSTSGAYKFVADDAAVEALKTSATVDFVVNATDGSLDSAAQTITITLAGTNDTPVLAAVSGGTVTDTAGDDIYTDVTGVLTGSDRDGDTVGFELSGSTGSLAAGFDVEKSSSYGTFYLNSTSGAYKFVADDAAVEALKTSATVDFVVNATDGSLDSAAQTITITLAGTNDTPVLAAVSGGTVTDTAGDDIYTDVTGVLTGSDRDGDTVGFELSGSTGSLAAGFDVEKSSSYGTFYLNSTSGAYKFVADDAAVEALKTSATVDFVVNATDGSLDSAAQTITITLAGTNDTPVLAAVSGGTVTDTAGDDIYTDVTGVLTGSDRDGDTVGFELSGSTGSLAAGFDVEKSSSYGTFYLNSTSGAYKFVADDAAVEALKTSATVDFVVNATDGSLDSAAQTITITLAGTNDTPVLAAVSGGTVTDTAGDDIYTDVTGVLTGSDRDGDTVGFELSGSTGSLAAGFDVEKSSSYGTFYLNSTSGAYKFVADDAAVEALKTSATVDFVVNATDGSLDSAAQTITITLAGTNDTPVLAAVSGGTVTDTAGDDIYTDVTGVLTGSDRDGDTVGFELSGSTGSLAAGFDVEKSSSYGTFYLNSTSGAYKFVADDAAVEALKTSATVDFVVNATDGSLDSAAQTITITLAGTNDTPVLAAVSGGTVTDTAGDDIYTDVTGVLTGSDRDGDTVGFELSGSTGSLAAGFDVEKSSSYGTFYLNSTSGAYKFVADDAAVEALKTSATVDFVVNATDGSLDSAAQTITITLAGTNDTPVLAAVSGGTVTDTAGDDIYTDVTGVLTGSDRDGDTVGFELSGSTGSLAAGFDVEKSSSYGTFYLNSTSGAYKFVADDAAVEALKTSATVDFVVNATDGSLDSAAQTITITLAGTNDTPVLAAVSGGTVTDTAGDDIYTDVTGVLTGSDRDGDTVGFELSGSTGSLAAGFDVEKSSSYGTFYLNSTSGAYKFVADDAAVEALKTSATVDFVVNATDGSLDSAAQTITITLAGTNDTPVLAAVSGGTVTDTAGDDIYTDVTGVLTGSDRDGDTVGFELSGSTGSLAAGFDVEKSSSYGTFYLNSTSGAYKFVADDAAVEALKTSATVDFVVNATDGSLDSAAQTITITLAGTNDTPVLAAVSGGTVTDTAGDDIYTDVTGVLTGSDRDGDTVGFELSGSTGSLAAGFDVEKSSSYGTFYLNSTSGAYKFVADDAAVEALKTSATVDFVVNATDGSLDSAAQTITITLAGTNDAPTILNSTNGAVIEDTSVNGFGKLTSGISVIFDDVDLTDAHSFSFVKNSGTLGGTLVPGSTIQATGPGIGFASWTYQVDNSAVQYLGAGENETETFTVTVNDGHGGTVDQLITVSIAGANDAPTAANLNLTTDEDTAYSGTLTATDVDTSDNDNLSFSLVGGASHGSVSLDSNGIYTYTPTGNYNGSDSFTYMVSDGHTGGSNTYTVNFTVTAVDDAPVADDSTASVTEDIATGIDVSGLITEVDGDAYTISATSTHGTVSVSGTMITFDPDADYYGDAEISYTVTDATGASLSDSGTIAVTVSPVEDEATGTLTITGSAAEGMTLSADTSGITDADGPISSTTYQWQFFDGGDWQDIVGETSVSYVIPDSQIMVGKDVRVLATTTDVLGGTTLFTSAGTTIANTEDEATGAIDIVGVVEEGATISFTAAPSINDEDGGVTSYSYQWQANDGSGWSDLAGETGVTLDIPSDQSMVGSDIRLVVVSTDDFGGTTEFVTGEYTVANVNDAPVIVSGDSNAVNEDAAVTGTIFAADDDGDSLTYTLTESAPTGLTLNSDGTYSFDASSYDSLAASETLDVTVGYQVDDGHGGSDTGTLTITVTGVNDDPTLTGGNTASVNEDAVVSGTLTASDVDATDTLTYSLTEAAPTGLTLNSNGTYSFDASSYDSLGDGVTQVVSVGYQVSDGNGGTDTGTLSITVTGVNDAPSLAAATGSYTDQATDDTFENITGTLAATDVDMDTLSYGIVGGTAGSGSVSISDAYGTLTVDTATGAYTFVANDRAIEAFGANGSFGYVVTVSDGSTTASQTLTINVTQDGTTETEGSDVLDGTTGAFNFAGLGGHDLYYVDGDDTVTEAWGDGTDHVSSSVSFTLGANIENLTLTGTAVTGTGNSEANTLIGNNAANTLTGLDGNDVARWRPRQRYAGRWVGR